MRRSLLALGIAAVVTGAACTPRAPVTPALKADPAKLLDEVEAVQARTQRVQGTAKVKITSPDVKGATNAFLAAEKRRLHVELLDFFGNPVAVLIADGDRFGYFDARRRTWYRGDATAENVSRFLPITLPPWELATIIRGSAPILEGTPAQVADASGGRVDLVIDGGQVTQTIGIGEGLAIVSSRLRRVGDASGLSPHYDLSFGRFIERGAAIFPTDVRLDAPRASARVEVSWKPDVEVNGPPRPELFRLEPPAGATVVELPPGGAIPEVEIPLGAQE
ncbi:MAG TPA: DUF4292 domain-containing protein [Anaeromyxobacteraceae bacterium]|nr:DUF4292 domain-containing protein [Anaeromyxobacteraceae bacterium]